MTYLIYALREIKSGFGKTSLTDTDSSQTQISNTQLTSLINELVELPDRTLSILDDYHCINRQNIHDAVSNLLEHAPPQVHFVISARADPPLPIARLRGRGQVTELRQNDLRFTLDEAGEFLAKNPSTDLSHSDISALVTRTEGWAAGLQMAAASLVDQSDVSAFEPEGFIRVFLDHGTVLAGLLETTISDTNDPRLLAYTHKLLDAFFQPADLRMTTPKNGAMGPIEPLSERELEVLGLLPSSLSSTKMANELSISVNTLRSHLKNIYTKLDAHSRYEASARAKEAGLL